MIGKVQQDSFQSLRIQIDGFNSTSQLSEPIGSLLGGLGSPYGSLGLGDSLSSLDRDCPTSTGSRSAATLARSQSSPAPKGSPTAQSQTTSRYKTEMCRPFSEHGTCKYGDKCQFAHGSHEVRNINRHPKYKTDLCKTYHSVGFCPYGPRCHFIHALDEMRPQPSNTNLEKKANSPVKQLPMFGGQSETSDWSFPGSPTSCDKQNEMNSAVSQLNKYFNMSGGGRPSPSSIDSSRSGSFCSDDVDSSSLPSSSPPPEQLGSSPRRPLFNRLSFA